MRKVYVITQGEYSDYHIVGVCSSRKKAELVLAHLTTSHIDDPRIEAYELDEVDLLIPGWANYTVWMQRNGDSKVERSWDQYPPARTTVHETSRTVWLHVTGYFESKEHAVKVTNEIRTRLLAEEVQP